jgi:hypothetical protein
MAKRKNGGKRERRKKEKKKRRLLLARQALYHLSHSSISETLMPRPVVLRPVGFLGSLLQSPGQSL